MEALTQGLSGFGRADAPKDWGASVFVQVIDPTAFGGSAQFRHQTNWLATACRSTPPAPGVDVVRLPGERGLSHKRHALMHGVALYPGILEALAPFAEQLEVEPPQPITGT